jgi:predicted Mrr-cat superfamily restriction endonuclease
MEGRGKMNEKPEIAVVRSKPHQKNREKQFVEEGILSLGWPLLMNLENADRETIERGMKEHYPDEASGVCVSQIFNFVHLKPGSYVLSPSYRDRSIHVFKTVSHYEFRPEWASDEIGNPHVIHAEYLKTVSREVFDELVQRALLAAKKTVTMMTKYADRILPVIEGDSGDRPAPTFQRPKPDPTARDMAEKKLIELLGSKDDQISLQAAMTLFGKSS